MRALIGLLLVICAGASAQTFPQRPVRIVIGFPPGGGIDTVARFLAPKMSESLGQPVVVDNRPGGGGVLGTEVVAKSAPDGHTLFFGTMGNLAVNPVFLPNLPFSMERDLAPVTQVVSTSFLVYVHPALPAKSIPELMQHAKARDDRGEWSAKFVAEDGQEVVLRAVGRRGFVRCTFEGAFPHRQLGILTLALLNQIAV